MSFYGLRKHEREQASLENNFDNIEHKLDILISLVKTLNTKVDALDKKVTKPRKKKKPKKENPLEG